MKRLTDACNEYLNRRGLVTRNVDIKRAYWRHAKQKNGFNIGLENQVYIISEYLILNNLTKTAIKFKLCTTQTAASQPSKCKTTTDTESVPTVARTARQILARI